VQVVTEAKDDVTDLEKAGSESPIIRFVNFLIFDAIKQGASDIHIEPKEEDAEGAVPHRRGALRGDEPAARHCTRRSCRA